MDERAVGSVGLALAVGLPPVLGLIFAVVARGVGRGRVVDAVVVVVGFAVAVAAPTPAAGLDGVGRGRVATTLVVVAGVVVAAVAADRRGGGGGGPLRCRTAVLAAKDAAAFGGALPSLSSSRLKKSSLIFASCNSPVALLYFISHSRIGY